MRKLIAVLILGSASTSMAQTTDEKLDNLIRLVQNLRDQVQQLQGELQDLKGRPQVPAAPPATLQPQVALPGRPEKTLPLDQNSDPGAGGAERQRNWTSLGINLGRGDASQPINLNARARYFRPFGSNSQYFALQSEGGYNYFRDRQESQFDLGVVARQGYFQLGGFTSLGYVRIANLDAGGALGQFVGTAEVMLPILRARMGGFATHSFLDDVILRNIGSQAIYLKVADQYGVSGSVELPWNSWADASLAFLHRSDPNQLRFNTFNQSPAAASYPNGGRALRTGITARWTKPLPFAPWAFTAEGGYNEALLTPQNSWRVALGVSLQAWPRPRQFGGEAAPAPVEIPRIRYEVLMKDQGNAIGPVANAGASRAGLAPGAIILDGSASLRAVRYKWTELSSNGVTINNADAVSGTFTAKPSTTYVFQLQVWDVRGFTDKAQVTISTSGVARILSFSASNSSIIEGQQANLQWDTKDADSVMLEAIDTAGTRTIIGKVAASGAMSVTPHSTTIYRLTAQNGSSAATTQSVTITVGAAKPSIISFVGGSDFASIFPPLTNVSLVWSTQNAKTATINGIPVSVNGSQTFLIANDTTFTLVVSNGNTADDVSSSVTIRVQH